MIVKQVSEEGWFNNSIPSTPAEPIDDSTSPNLEGSGAFDPEDKEEKEKEEEEEEKHIEEKDLEDTEVIIDDTLQGIFNNIVSDKDRNYLWYDDRPVDSIERINEFIDINVKDRQEKALEEIDTLWYSNKSDNFKKVAEFAELTQGDFSKVADLINRESILLNIEQLNPDDDYDAESIVSEYLKTRSESPELILSEIKDLKERNKLLEKAKIYHPELVRIQKQTNDSIVEAERERVQQFYSVIEDNDKKIKTFLGADEIGSLKIDKEDKYAIYQALSYNPEIGGFGIHKMVEELHKNGKYDLLSKAILLLQNEEKFDKKYITTAKSKAADSLKGRLRHAVDQTVSQESHQPRQKQVIPKNNGAWFSQ